MDEEPLSVRRMYADEIMPCADGVHRVEPSVASGDATLNEGAGNGIDDTPDSRPNRPVEIVARKKRTIEWTFFTDDGPWRAGSNFRSAKCRSCQLSVRSKRETMSVHIRKCPQITSRKRRAYEQDRDAWHNVLPSSGEKTNGKVRVNASSAPRPSKPPSALHGKRLDKQVQSKFEEHLLRFAISEGLPLNALQSPELLEAFRCVNKSAILPHSKPMLTAVLDRLAQKEWNTARSAYEAGAAVTISATTLSPHGWKARTQDQWFGFCRLLRHPVTSRTHTEFSCLRAIGECLVTQEASVDEYKRELSATVAEVDQHTPSVLQSAGLSEYGRAKVVAIVTDSAKTNPHLRKELGTEYPGVRIVSCFCHQLYLTTCNILSHSDIEPYVQLAKSVVLYFRSFVEEYEKVMAISLSLGNSNCSHAIFGNAESRWYGHLKQLVAISRCRDVFAEYVMQTPPPEDVLRHARATEAVEAIQNSHLWTHMGILAELLQPFIAEIERIEAPDSCLADVTQGFGRVWAYLSELDSEDTQFASVVPGLLNVVLERWQWRFNLYYDPRLLVLAHALDPRLKFVGIKQGCGAAFSRRALWNYIHEQCIDMVDDVPELQQCHDDAQEARSAIIQDMKLAFANYARYHPCSDTTLHANFTSIGYWGDNDDSTSSAPFSLLACRVCSIVPVCTQLERRWRARELVSTLQHAHNRHAQFTKLVQVRTSQSVARGMMLHRKARDREPDEYIDGSSFEHEAFETALQHCFDNNDWDALQKLHRRDVESSARAFEDDDPRHADVDAMFHQPIVPAPTVKQRQTDDSKIREVPLSAVFDYSEYLTQAKAVYKLT